MNIKEFEDIYGLTGKTEEEKFEILLSQSQPLDKETFDRITELTKDVVIDIDKPLPIETDGDGFKF